MPTFKGVHHQKPRYVCELLDDIGDGSGIKNFNGDYSLLPDYEGRIVAPPNRVIQLHSMHVWISTVGLAAINRVGYGSGSVGLFGQPGILAQASEKNSIGSYVVFLDLAGNISGPSVLFHYDWTRLGGEAVDDIGMRFASPSEAPWMIFRFDFVKLFGAPIVLRGNREGKFAVRVGGNNFTSLNLSNHSFVVRGLDYSDQPLT